MKRLTLDEQRAVVSQWRRAGEALDRVRYEALRTRPYDWTVVDALLDLGDRFGRSRNADGMVEMQRIFMRARIRHPG